MREDTLFCHEVTSEVLGLGGWGVWAPVGSTGSAVSGEACRERTLRNRSRRHPQPPPFIIAVTIMEPNHLIGTVYSSLLNRWHCSCWKKPAHILNPCTCRSPLERFLCLHDEWLAELWILVMRHLWRWSERGYLLCCNFQGLWLIKKYLLDLCEYICFSLEFCKWKYQLSLISVLVLYLIPDGLLKEIMSGGMLLVCGCVRFRVPEAAFLERCVGNEPLQPRAALNVDGEKRNLSEGLQVNTRHFFLTSKMKWMHGRV